MILNEQTVKDIDKAFKALEVIEDIRAEIEQMETLVTKFEVLDLIDKRIEGVSE